MANFFSIDTIDDADAFPEDCDFCLQNLLDRKKNYPN